MTTPLKIDDQDPSIVYSPTQWKRAGRAIEFDGTTMEALVSGATSQLQFTGTSIAVFGTIPGTVSGTPRSPHSIYSIDGQLVHDFAPSMETDPQFNLPFYQSDTLPIGDHTFLVTSLGEIFTFYLDYFEVTGDSSQTALSLTTTTTSQVTLSTYSSNISPDSSSKGISTGPIVGGILGGLALLATVLICLIMAWKAWKSIHTIKDVNANLSYVGPGFHGAVEPFYLTMSQREHSIVSSICDI
ncbi:hypothetical protein BDQ12DRAFT_666723 [Crucibulum laeve]|uniref:Uncharacterized protein n=1 Tax=Crucibulum laeve TaxID=68775 RepID=A0A5C3M0Z5_9AGAR|nr:hypothetical protein BDQ12DRAFT_666723 [Crucibulum laeve]